MGGPARGPLTDHAGGIQLAPGLVRGGDDTSHRLHSPGGPAVEVPPRELIVEARTQPPGLSPRRRRGPRGRRMAGVGAGQQSRQSRCTAGRPCALVEGVTLEQASPETGSSAGGCGPRSPVPVDSRCRTRHGSAEGLTALPRPGPLLPGDLNAARPEQPGARD